MANNEGAAPTGIGSGSTPQRTIKSSPPRTPCKWQRWLRAVLESPKTSRELERDPVFDHVVHFTASEVRKMRIHVITEMVTIQGYQGEGAGRPILHCSRFGRTSLGTGRSATMIALSLSGRRCRCNHAASTSTA